MNNIDSENKKDEMKDIENNNYNFNIANNDENTENNSLKDDVINNNNDINNLIIDQKTNLAKQYNNNKMNINNESDNNKNETRNKNSLLNKLFELGKKNEYKDRIESDKRNQIENMNNKLVSSNNYNSFPQENNNQIIFNKFKDVKIDKKFQNNNKQSNNNKDETLQDNIGLIKTDIYYNNLMKIKKNKNKKISFNEK